MDMVTTLLMAAIHVKKYGSIKNKVMVTEHRKKQMLERYKKWESDPIHIQPGGEEISIKY